MPNDSNCTNCNLLSHNQVFGSYAVRHLPAFIVGLATQCDTLRTKTLWPKTLWKGGTGRTPSKKKGLKL
jgi:hypothetical protein